MVRPDVAAEVVREIERAAGRRVAPGDDLVADLGLDSLTLTTLAVELEDRFRLRLDDASGLRPRTVADLVALVEEKLA
jgi:acyl carrier protein